MRRVVLPGRLVLNAESTFTGSTSVDEGLLTVAGSLLGTDAVTLNGGRLKLGGNDRFGNSTQVLLRGGVLDANGFSDILGTLALDGTATLELGAGASILHFAKSESNPWNGTLSITNWSGSIAGSRVDQLFFGTDATGLSATQ